MTKVYSEIPPPHYGKLQIWDDLGGLHCITPIIMQELVQPAQGIPLQRTEGDGKLVTLVMDAWAAGALPSGLVVKSMHWYTGHVLLVLLNLPLPPSPGTLEQFVICPGIFSHWHRLIVSSLTAHTLKRKALTIIEEPLRIYTIGDGAYQEI